MNSKRKGESEEDSSYLNLLKPRAWASQVTLVVKNQPANTGDIKDADLIPGLGISPGGVHGNPLKYSCLGKPMDNGAWWATVHRVAQSWRRLKRQHAGYARFVITFLPRSKHRNSAMTLSC